MLDFFKRRRIITDELALLRQEVAELVTVETERMQLENERHTVTSRFARLLEVSVDAIIAVNESQKIVLFNQGAESIFGYQVEEAMGQTIDLLLPPDLAEAHQQFKRAFAAAPEAAQSTGAQRGIVGRRKDGSEFPAEISISKLFQNDKLFFLVMLRDVTEHKRIEDALRESEKRYKQLLESVTDYIYTVKFEQGLPVETIHSPNCVAVTGYTSQEYEADPNLWYHMIHQEDRQVVMNQAGRLRAGESVSPIEHRIIHKDGSIRWVRNTTVIRKDEQSQVISYDGLIADITERKKAEQQIRYQASLIENVSDAIISTDFQSTIQSWNKAAEIVYGWQTNEAIGQSMTTLLQTKFAPPRQDAALQQVMDTGSWEGEVIQKHKDGSDLHIFASISLIRDLQGVPIGLVSVNRDISERMRLQDRLEAIYELGQELTLLRAEATIVKRVLETAANVLQFESAGYGVVDENAVELEYRYHLIRGECQPISLRLRLDDGYPQDIGIAVIYKKRAIHVADTHQDTRYFLSTANSFGRSVLCVPMKIGERLMGVLSAVCLDPNHFTPDDQKLLQTLADQTAVAIENAQLYDEIRQRVDELTALNEQAQQLRQATAALTSTLDLNQVLESILTHLEHVVPYDSACVFLWEENELQAVATRGLNHQIIGSRCLSNFSENKNIEGNVHALMLVSVLQGLTDIDSVPGWLAVPLMVRAKVIGYLTLDDQRMTTYSQNEAALAQAFANQAATAIHNARLYNSEREQFRRLQKSQAQLIQAEKMAALGRLVASVAHEINNPLQAMHNSLTLLERELKGRQRAEKLTHHLRVSRSEIERISTIVHRMRKFYRPQPTGQALTADSDSVESFFHSSHEELKPTDLHNVLDDVLQLTYKQLQQANINVKQIWADNFPLIQGNPDHLKQVFLNLILNAIEAMGDQGGTLQVHTKLYPAQSRDEHMPQTVSIEFSDTGPGMPEETLSRLFEPFFTTKEHGSGLGLFVSYKIIQAHHGQINVDSHQGLGTTFTILLPLNDHKV